jgi:hypothetical protein
MNEINQVEDVEFTEVVTENPNLVDEDMEVSAPSLQALLNPARGFDESYDDYCVRRKSAQRAVKQYLGAGKLVHNSLPDSNKKGVTYHKPKEQ